MKSHNIPNDALLSSLILTNFEVAGSIVVVTLTPNAKLIFTVKFNRNLFEVYEGLTSSQKWNLIMLPAYADHLLFNEKIRFISQNIYFIK